MKKLLSSLLLCVMAFALAGCNDTGERSGTLSEIDVDLTGMSATMVYAEVYNMLTSPADYLGKTVKMSGSFSVYEEADRNYYACLIADATACCSQGIEFVLDGDPTYPEDYPELNSLITVTGIFDTYIEDGYLYCQLLNATLEK